MENKRAMNSILIIICLYILTQIRHYKCQTDDIFCHSKDNLDCMLIVDTNIFIGTRTYLYRYSLERNKLVDALSTNELFGPDFAEVFGGGIFDFNPCARNRLPEFCKNAGKAKDLVLIFGKTNGHYRRYGYNSYHAIKNSPFFVEIQNNNEMPWNLSPKGRLNESIWPQGVGEDHVEDLIGLAFVSNGNADTLFLGTQANDDGSYHSGAIISKQLNSDGLFNTTSKWKDAGIGGSGLIDIDGILFTLDNRNKVHEMKLENDYYSKKKSFDAKEFFNCYNNSILLNITAKIRTTTTLPTTRVTTRTTITTRTTKKATITTKTTTVSPAGTLRTSRLTSEVRNTEKITEKSAFNWSTTQNIPILNSTDDVVEINDKKKTGAIAWLLFLLGILVALVVCGALCILVMWLRKKKPNEHKRRELRLAGQKDEEEIEGKVDNLDMPPEYLLEEMSENDKTGTTGESDTQRTSSALSKTSRRSGNEEKLKELSKASALSTASKRSKNEKSIDKSKSENL